MITIDPKSIKTGQFHSHMLSAIAPRPIAFASTIDKQGNPNLSPFSFFNAFGSKPPTLIFSPARRVRDNTIKNTLENVYDVAEVVINVVSYNMVQQTSLSSCEYPKGTNEFVKAGFTQLESQLVKPFRVKESPVQFECRVKKIIETGMEGGAGNLVICEILLMHINNEVIDKNGNIDPNKIDLVGRCGQNWYSRTSGSALFEVAKPNRNIGIGIDSLPVHIRNSEILSGNDLGQLGNIENLPDKAMLNDHAAKEDVGKLLSVLKEGNDHTGYHLAAKELIKAEKPNEALMLLMLQSK
jgi:flavin reductase (DIM6/NTAB) family NADH-FMN oxidoreductase RutF